MAKLTMTMRELVREMRAVGIQCTDRIVSDGIASGLYPFGNVVNVGQTGRRTIQVFRVDFEAWLRSKTPQAADTLQLVRKSG